MNHWRRGIGKSGCGKPESRGLELLSSIEPDHIRRFREAWDLAPLTVLKKIERLRSFFKFCIESNWIARNPASGVKPPKAVHKPTIPYTDEEVRKIVEACKFGRHRLLIYVLRYSGLRIGDAIRLGPDKVDGNCLHLYTAKTGVPVRIPLPEFVIEGLKKLPGPYWFHDYRGGQTETMVENARRAFEKIFKRAGVLDGVKFHRLRDSFAISLLQKGVPIESVSMLLGHQSIRITEKHYAPWIKSRQENLEKLVMSTWK